MNRQDILGRWNLVEWVQRYDDGRLVYPLGRAVTGYIRYDADGSMHQMICSADRPHFTTGGQWNASDAEKAAAYSSFLVYAGTFEVEGDEVRHHLAISLYPDWTGGTQKRQARIDGDRLELTTGHLEAGTSEARRAVLTWRRAA